MSWLETVQGIITLVGTVVALIGAIVGITVKLIKALKEIKKNKNWAKIIELADIAIKAAEKTQLEGKDKKAQVLASVQSACAELEIEVDVDALDNYIDECISFVNTFIKR